MLLDKYLGGDSTDMPSNMVSSHVAMTYSALVTLVTLGDDLSRVNKSKILRGLSTLQNSNGRYATNRIPLLCFKSRNVNTIIII